MLKERVLLIGLDGVVDAFAGSHWKFYEDYESEGFIRVEMNRECLYVVELPYSDAREKSVIVDRLGEAGFFQQKIRIVSEY